MNPSNHFRGLSISQSYPSKASMLQSPSMLLFNNTITNEPAILQLFTILHVTVVPSLYIPSITKIDIKSSFILIIGFEGLNFLS